MIGKVDGEAAQRAQDAFLESATSAPLDYPGKVSEMLVSLNYC